MSSGGAARTGWGSLRPPSAADVRGRGGRSKALTAPPPPLAHLVVLDFEWTADNRQRMLPCSEITQWPSVLVRLDGRHSHVVDEFDTFVKPTLNVTARRLKPGGWTSIHAPPVTTHDILRGAPPCVQPRLTPFSIALTAITQADVDGAPTIEAVLPRYLQWLRQHGLCDADGNRVGAPWCLCTWSDADIGGQLASECRHKGVAVPPCLDSWVDLKQSYQRHFKLEPRGGLQACVERLGLPFEGRAHNGLVDSRNTARIVLHMARAEGMHGPAHVFTRPTRGLDADGYAYGSRAARVKRRPGQPLEYPLEQPPVRPPEQPSVRPPVQPPGDSPPPQPLSYLSQATICCGESVYVSPSSRITSDSICSVAEKAQQLPQRAWSLTGVV